MVLFEMKTAAKGVPPSTSAPPQGGGFSVQKFVDSFGVLAQADGGIKKLREMALALAVRGLLVHQDPSEGSSESLVAQLEAGRANLATSSRVRTDLPVVGVDEAPFVIPSSWRWVRLGHLGGLLGGGTPAKSNAAFWDGKIPWVSPKDMKRPYIDDAEDHISEAAVEGSAVKLIPKRSLLFVVRGMILAHSFPVALTIRKVTVNQDMKALLLAAPEMDEYLLRACWAARARVLKLVERSSHGTCRLETDAIENLPIPLPPLPEQKRIVAKVDELMRLLDDLEAKQVKKGEVQTRLRTAALDALTSAEGPEEFEAAWRRVRENFGALFERVEGVGELRRAILELGVRGHLTSVAQGDEPVSLLRSRIDRERSELLEGRRVGGRGHHLHGDGAHTAPYTVPDSWAWCVLEDVAGHIVDGTHHTPKYVDRGCDFISAKDIRSGTIVFEGCRQITKGEFDELRKRCRPRRGNVLVTKSGSIGEVAVVNTDRDFTLFESVALVPVVPSVNSRYASFVIHLGASGHFGSLHRKGIGVPHLHLVDLRRLPFPLPPRPVQDRIVAKVEQLMKLCDDLEAKLRHSEETAAKLVEAVVAEMVA